MFGKNFGIKFKSLTQNEEGKEEPIAKIAFFIHIHIFVAFKSPKPSSTIFFYIDTIQNWCTYVNVCMCKVHTCT